MDARASLISDAMRAAVGRELRRLVSYPISESDIRRWAVAVYWPEHPPRLFWDAEHAAGTVHGGIVAPEEFNPFAWMAADPPGWRPPGASATDSTEDGLGIPGPGLMYSLNGGNEAEYGVRMRPGDVITSVTKLADYYEREGRLGRMLFTVSESDWTNQRGEWVKRVRATVIRY
jgi:hypothetical protein